MFEKRHIMIGFEGEVANKEIRHKKDKCQDFTLQIARSVLDKKQNGGVNADIQQNVMGFRYCLFGSLIKTVGSKFDKGDFTEVKSQSHALFVKTHKQTLAL